MFQTLLRHYRLAAGLTQESLAERAGMSARAIQNLERGDRRPYPDTAWRLAEALQLAGNARAEFDDAARPRPRGKREAVCRPAPDNLPVPLTACIGREAELADVQALLEQSRVVTLLGPGGSGKTRLALELGRQFARAGQPFADGVWFVELDAVTEAGLVPNAVAFALGVGEERGRTLLSTLCAALRDRRMLVILDNAEHVVWHTAALAEALLQRCPHLRLVVTSRQPLGLPCERTRLVPPLGLPPFDAAAKALSDSPAVQLFRERARSVLPDQTLDDEANVAIAAICRKLDGMPLALELAAARLRGLSLDDLAVRLDEPLDVLSAASHRALHQHSLREAIGWSFALLNPVQQRALCRLSVFSGGWTLAAAESVVGAEAALTLSQLVDHSLVQVERGARGQRYRLLETIRQYASEELVASGDFEPAHQAHLAFVVDLVEQARLGLEGAEQMACLARLDAEVPNARAALQWSIEHENPDAALRLVGVLGGYWQLRGEWTEGFAWFERALSIGGETHADAHADARVRARALRAGGRLAVNMRNDAAEDWLFQSLEIARELGDTEGIARSLVELGVLWIDTVDLDRATRAFEEALALAKAADVQPVMARTLGALGQVQLDRANYGRALRLLHGAKRAYHAVGDPTGEAAVTLQLGMAYLETDESGRAEQSLDEAQRLLEQVGDAPGVGWAQHDRARLALDCGRPVEACAWFERSVDVFRRIGDGTGLAWSLHGLGRARLALGCVDSATALFEEGLVLFRGREHPRGAAWALYNLAWLAADDGSDAAWAMLSEAISLFRSQAFAPGLAACLLVAAHLVLETEPALAARWLGLAEDLAYVSAVDRRRAEPLQQSAREKLGAGRFEMEWSIGAGMSPLQRDAEVLGLTRPHRSVAALCA